MVLFMLAAAHVYSRLWNAYKVEPRADAEVQFHLHGQYLRKECRQYARPRTISHTIISQHTACASTAAIARVNPSTPSPRGRRVPQSSLDTEMGPRAQPSSGTRSSLSALSSCGRSLGSPTTSTTTCSGTRSCDARNQLAVERSPPSRDALLTT